MPGKRSRLLERVRGSCVCLRILDPSTLLFSHIFLHLAHFYTNTFFRYHFHRFWTSYSYRERLQLSLHRKRAAVFTMSNTSLQSPITLMSLPAEIRQIIFEHVFEGSQIRSAVTGYGRTLLFDREKAAMPLIMVSRQYYQEARISRLSNAQVDITAVLKKQWIDTETETIAIPRSFQLLRTVTLDTARGSWDNLAKPVLLEALLTSLPNLRSLVLKTSISIYLDDTAAGVTLRDMTCCMCFDGNCSRAPIKKESRGALSTLFIDGLLGTRLDFRSYEWNSMRQLHVTLQTWRKIKSEIQRDISLCVQGTFDDGVVLCKNCYTSRGKRHRPLNDSWVSLYSRYHGTHTRCLPCWCNALKLTCFVVDYIIRHGYSSTHSHRRALLRQALLRRRPRSRLCYASEFSA